MLTRGTKRYYGTNRCSNCGKVLQGMCMTVGDDTIDADGHYWRAFCTTCEQGPGIRQLSNEEIIYIMEPADEVTR